MFDRSSYFVFVVLTELPLLITNQLNQNLNFIDSGILWLENHSVTATAMGENMISRIQFF